MGKQQTLKKEMISRNFGMKMNIRSILVIMILGLSFTARSQDDIGALLLVSPSDKCSAPGNTTVQVDLMNYSATTVFPPYKVSFFLMMLLGQP